MCGEWTRVKNTLFVTNIPNNVTKYVLYELMQQVSKVHGFFYDRERGYCFVDYETAEDLEYTCRVFNGIKLYGRRIYFSKSEDCTEILVRNIDKGVDTAFLFDVFGKFGSCYVDVRKEEERVGIVVYRKREHALRAISTVNEKMIGNSVVFLEINK